MSSKPLNLIIKSTVQHMLISESTIMLNNNPQNTEVFNDTNPKHINIIVNDLMRDLDNIVRFKIKNYAVNYLKLTGQEDSEWKNYLEYGTKDPLIIELQRLGFERQVAIEISGKGSSAFMMNDDFEITEINIDTLQTLNLSGESSSQIKQLNLG